MQCFRVEAVKSFLKGPDRVSAFVGLRVSVPTAQALPFRYKSSQDNTQKNRCGCAPVNL